MSILYFWQNVPVSGLLLKEKTKSFAKELGIPFFSASNGWLTNSKKRNGIVFKPFVLKVLGLKKHVFRVA